MEWNYNFEDMARQNVPFRYGQAAAGFQTSFANKKGLLLAVNASLKVKP